MVFEIRLVTGDRTRRDPFISIISSTIERKPVILDTFFLHLRLYENLMQIEEEYSKVKDKGIENGVKEEENIELLQINPLFEEANFWFEQVNNALADVLLEHFNSTHLSIKAYYYLHQSFNPKLDVDGFVPRQLQDEVFKLIGLKSKKFI